MGHNRVLSQPEIESIFYKIGQCQVSLVKLLVSKVAGYSCLPPQMEPPFLSSWIRRIEDSLYHMQPSMRT
jgi:hypothetical protein